MLRTITLVALTCLVCAAPAHAKKHKHGPKHPPAAAAPAPAPAPAPKEEKVEKIEEVEAVEAVEPGDGKPADPQAAEKGTPKGDAPLGPVDYLGHMHSAVVHLPIAWMLLLLLVDGAAWGLGRKELEAAGLYLTGLALISFIPAAITGLVRVTQLAQDPESMAPAILHRNVMYGCAALCAVLLGIKVKSKNKLDGPLRWVYLGLLAAAVGLVSLGGHLGGKLVFGDDFLPF